MTRKSRLWWFIAALVGVLAAVCLGFLAIPTLFPPQPSVPVVVMSGYDPTDVTRFQPKAEPPAVAQPVPEPAAVSKDAGERLENAQDRADWIGGATVTCDLSGLLPTPSEDEDVTFSVNTAFLNMDEGVNLKGAVDITSRFYTPVQGGRISFTVTEVSGSARVILPQFEGQDDERRHMAALPLRVRWSGAVPGSTVGCDGAWEEERGTLSLEIIDIPPTALTEEGNWNTGDGFMPPVIRGCGLMMPMPMTSGSMEVAAQRCVLQIERRNMRFPLIANRGEAIAVEILPGETTHVELRLPDEPSLYQPPDLTELQTAADIASYYGSDVVADALDELVDQLANGDWDGEALESLMNTFGPGQPPGDAETTEIVYEDTGLQSGMPIDE